MSAAVGVDVGGTNVRVALVGEDGTVQRSERAGTPFGAPGELADTIVGLLRRLDAADLPTGVGVAGTVDRDGTVRYSANVGLDDAPVRRLLEERLGHDVLVHNDGTVATWGECRVGAAREHDDALLVTLGTGVGGGIVVRGRLLTGIGTEVGHIVVQTDGRTCPCGNLGCLEAYASGNSIARRAQERLQTWDRPTPLRDDEVTGRHVVEAAGAGDPLAQDVLAWAGRFLGVGIASLVNVLDPSVVLIGGGAGEAAFPHVLPSLTSSLRAQVFGLSRRTLPRLVPAELGDAAGVVGAALLAAQDAAAGA